MPSILPCGLAYSPAFLLIQSLTVNTDSGALSLHGRWSCSSTCFLAPGPARLLGTATTPTSCDSVSCGVAPARGLAGSFCHAGRPVLLLHLLLQCQSLSVPLL